MPQISDREARAKLRLAARSYRKAKARYAAHPSAKRAAHLAACEAELQLALASSGALAVAA